MKDEYKRWMSENSELFPATIIRNSKLINTNAALINSAAFHRLRSSTHNVSDFRLSQIASDQSQQQRRLLLELLLSNFEMLCHYHHIVSLS